MNFGVSVEANNAAAAMLCLLEALTVERWISRVAPTFLSSFGCLLSTPFSGKSDFSDFFSINTLPAQKLKVKLNSFE